MPPSPADAQSQSQKTATTIPAHLRPANSVPAIYRMAACPAFLRSPRQRLTVSQLDASYRHISGPVLRSKPKNRHTISALHPIRTPSVPPQHGRAPQLQDPIGNLALLI